MICLLAFIVFGILGIFSATHRRIAKDAFDCIFKRITFRKCTTGLDIHLKTQLTSLLMGRTPRLASKVYRHFELISWFFTILLIVSLGYSVYGGYNYYMYGNCNGPESHGFCVFNEILGNKYSEGEEMDHSEIIYPGVDDDPGFGPDNAKVTIIEFGCFRCPFTKKAESTVKQVLEEYEGKIRYVYRDFPLDELHIGADIHAEAADCALDQDKYWEYHDLLFEKQDIMINHNESGLIALAGEINLDTEKFEECLTSRIHRIEVMNDFEDGHSAGVFGTPTFFINNRTLVGPQPFKAFKKIIEEELKK